jgi:hypothetical protein
MIRVILAQQPSIKGRARARLALGALVDGLQGWCQSSSCAHCFVSDFGDSGLYRLDMILKQVNVDQPDIAVANVDIQRCKKKRNKNKNIGQS